MFHRHYTFIPRSRYKDGKYHGFFAEWWGRKSYFLSHLYLKNELFYQDRLGTNIGEALYKSMFFSGGETAESTHGPALAMSFTQPLVRNQFSLIELNCDDAVQGAFLGVVCLYSFPWNEAEQEVNFARTGSGHT
jgi:hypothetical protein